MRSIILSTSSVPRAAFYGPIDALEAGLTALATDEALLTHVRPS